MAVSIPKESREVETRSDWATPKAVYDLINLKYGPFTLDPCASAENAKCEKFFTQEDDGLVRPWSGRAFVNCPYGKELPKWAAKGVKEAKENMVSSVFLIPPRVGTPWFQDFCSEANRVVFLRGRVLFDDPAGNRTSPMDDSCLVVFEAWILKFYGTHFSFWDWKADLAKMKAAA